MVADVVGRPLRSIPNPGRLVLVDEMSLHTGGCAINTATALVRLGLPVEVIGKAGADPFGDYLVDQLVRRGIGVEGVIRDPSTGTSATMIMVQENGERRYVHYIGANARLTLEDISFDRIASASILHVAGALVMPGIDGEPTAQVLRQAQEAGVITCLDTVWDDTGRWNRLEPCLPYLDYFVPTLEEAQGIAGCETPHETATWLIDRGVGVVVLKMASQGCYVMSAAGEAFFHPAFDVEVVDTTGAGDAFAAGFITGILEGWPLPHTARFANAVAGLCITGVGASGGTTTMPETLAFMESTPLKSSIV
jgi:sugar/nucleoside kinase (ribokinase family)